MTKAIAIISMLIYGIFLDIGFIYLYGWQHWSVWWFLLACLSSYGFNCVCFKILGIKDEPSTA